MCICRCIFVYLSVYTCMYVCIKRIPLVFLSAFCVDLICTLCNGCSPVTLFIPSIIFLIIRKQKCRRR